MMRNNTKNRDCKPEEIALKSFFMGPSAENASWVEELIVYIFREWTSWRKSMYKEDGSAITATDQQSPMFQEHISLFRHEIDELLQRFNTEVPSFSPRYIGHMLTESSLPALLGHILTLLYNPNNISGEVSRVGLEIEKNAIGALLSMMGFNTDRGCGHFTSGGTVANIEGALRARARTYRWIAVGAAARKQGLYAGSLFESAHMGWEKHDELQTNLASTDGPASTGTSGNPGNNHAESVIEEYHMLSSNPFEVADKLKSLFDEPYHGPVMLVPGNKHYSWNKAAEVLGLGKEAFWEAETDEAGRMDTVRLARLIDRARDLSRPIMLVASVAGTTELGEVDPIDTIQEILDTRRIESGIDIWHHVDAAYGGFFCTLMHDKTDHVLEYSVMQALRSICRANSATIDPHKLGFVPYASGAFLCRDRREYVHSMIDAPYIDFKSGGDAGLNTLEGSRSAAGAVSTWLTSRVIGFDRLGYGRILERTVFAAREVAHGLMNAHPLIRVNQAGDTNIVTFCVAHPGERITETNRRAFEIFKRYTAGGDERYFVSKTTLGLGSNRRLLEPFAAGWQALWDADELVLIRLVLLNPLLGTKETNISYIEEFIQGLAEMVDELYVL